MTTENFECMFAGTYTANVRLFRRWYVRRLIERANYNISKAARIAGMDRSGFRRLAKTLGVLDELPRRTPTTIPSEERK